MTNDPPTGRPRRRVHGEIVLVDERTVGWRLLAANGRALAISVTTYRRPSLCRASLVRLLREDPMRMCVRVVRLADSPEWGWLLHDNEFKPLARSARVYSRRSQAQKSAAALLDLLGGDEAACVWADHTSS